MNEIKDIKSKINYSYIKSSYIIKKVLSFLNEKQKLNIIKYSNELQKICLVDILYYKKISGKYKIGEKNGKGKEFIIDTNRLIFEGEYINGKRNGNKRIYYNPHNYLFQKNQSIIFINYILYSALGSQKVKKNFDGLLRFEGEYLEGKRIGKGKEYYYDDKLEFEGEYLNGERNGKGKKYNYDGKLEFEGEYLNGVKWNGKGYNRNSNIEYEIKYGKGIIKEYNYIGKLLFEGEYLNGKKMEI